MLATNLARDGRNIFFCASLLGADYRHEIDMIPIYRTVPRVQDKKVRIRLRPSIFLT